MASPDDKKKMYYDSIYARKGNEAMRPEWVYRDWFRFLKPVMPGKTFLDVGCGTGLLLKIATEAGLAPYGLDLSDQAVAISRRNAPNAHVVQGEGEHLPFQDGMFDYVCCIGSLEHYADLERGVAELKRVANANAKFLFVVPNDEYFFWKLKKIKKGTAQREFEVLKNLDQWKDFFMRAGLEIISIHQDKYPMKELNTFQYLNPYKIARRLAYKAIWLFMPMRFTYQFVMVIRKKLP